MYLNRIISTTATLLVGAGIYAGYQQIWKGMIQASPAAKLPYAARDLSLTGFRVCPVAVSDLPDALKDLITTEDVEGWTAPRLRKTGMRVVSETEQMKAYLKSDFSSDEKWLASMDRGVSKVNVNISAGATPSGAIYASVRLECNRGVFVHPGHWALGTVWEKGEVLYFASRNDAKDGIRTALNTWLDVLDRDWKICNK